MGAAVVSEGVEEEWQRAMITDLHVDLLQGYLIARPMPLLELLPWLADHGTPRG